MSKMTTLASGLINAADTITGVLVEPEDMPPSVLVHWPAAPSVAAPPRFPAVALAVIALMDQGMIRLAELGPRRP